MLNTVLVKSLVGGIAGVIAYKTVSWAANEIKKDIRNKTTQDTNIIENVNYEVIYDR